MVSATLKRQIYLLLEGINTCITSKVSGLVSTHLGTAGVGHKSVMEHPNLGLLSINK
jgi:hypothetical protein